MIDNHPKRTYIAIDLKSFYASAECADRGFDPLTTNLVVADPSRTEKTICLAVSPSLKAHGISGRARLFEVVQRVKEVNAERLQNAIRLGVVKKSPEDHKYHFSGSSFNAPALEADPSLELTYYIAPPRMKLYEEISTQIVSIYMKYVSADDIVVYSIDECFLDITAYLNTYHMTAHELAITMIRDVLKETGITATVGIGTNLYLAKVGMDIVAKKAPPDKDGVRIAELDEDKYKILLWDHQPLTDFWMIGPGTARKLHKRAMFTLGDVAMAALYDEGQFYKMFGIDAEILLDHVWGIEPCLMSDIKSYKNKSHSLSKGQVLSRPYAYDEAKLVFTEMVDLLATDLLSQNLTAGGLSFWVSFDPKSLEENPYYEGPVSIDFYGRLHPCHVGGSFKLRTRTNSNQEIMSLLLDAFTKKVDKSLLVRRLGIAAQDTRKDDGMYQLDLFTDYDALDKERRLQRALLEVRQKYGSNALLRGFNYMNGGTARERNLQIGGHKA